MSFKDITFIQLALVSLLAWRGGQILAIYVEDIMRNILVKLFCIIYIMYMSIERLWLIYASKCKRTVFTTIARPHNENIVNKKINTDPEQTATE